MRANSIIYPAPAGVEPSSRYEVAVDGQPSFTYMTTAPEETVELAGNTSSWTSFDLRGKVEVRIKRKGKPIAEATIRPRSAKVEAEIINGEVVFSLDKPCKLSVECEGDLADVLFIFANEPETDIPSPDDPNVVWFGPGVHEVGKFYHLKPDTMYYLAPGAFLKGAFAGGGDGTRITGRGVVSGAAYKWPGHLQERNSERVDLVKLQGDEMEFAGITLVDSPYYVIIARGKNNRFRDLKLIAWYHNTDGISSGAGARIDDCFLRVADDAFKPFVSDTHISRCVIWSDRASPFQLTWNAKEDSGGSVVSDCDVIHHMPLIKQDNEWAGAIFWSWHGGTAHIHDILFDDIRIEDRCPHLIKLFMQRNPWSVQEGEWGRFSRLHFRNITLDHEPSFFNCMLGHDERYAIDDVLFENLRIAGKWIRKPEDMNLETNQFVRNLRFIAPEP